MHSWGSYFFCSTRNGLKTLNLASAKCLSIVLGRFERRRPKACLGRHPSLPVRARGNSVRLRHACHHSLKNHNRERSSTVLPGLSSTRTTLSVGTLARGAEDGRDLAHRPVLDTPEVRVPISDHQGEERRCLEAARSGYGEILQGRLRFDVQERGPVRGRVAEVGGADGGFFGG
jgi:hypothetical protein